MKTLWKKLVTIGVAVMLLAAGCGPGDAPVNSLTVTFKNDLCSYNGAMAIKAGEVSVTMVVKHQELDAGMVVLTLDEGKTIDDLNAAPDNYGQPLWSHRVGEAERHVHPGERYTFKFTIETGPIYLVCFSGPPDTAIGVLGPIEVVK
jgi:hypothetical protein